jgi:hypothetical protein
MHTFNDQKIDNNSTILIGTCCRQLEQKGRAPVVVKSTRNKVIMTVILKGESHQRKEAMALQRVTAKAFMILLSLIGLAFLLLELHQERESIHLLPGPHLTLYGNHVPINARLSPLPHMPGSVEEAMKLMLTARTALNQRASFLQIGANNGEMFDPLYPSFKTTDKKSKWLGLQVEPQPDLFGSLSILHADAPDWAFYNGAVASPQYCINGTVRFCETKTPGIGDWQTQGQINQISNHCDPAIGMHSKTRACVTSFDQLIFRHASPVYLDHIMSASSNLSPSRTYNIDHLQIDVEGKDYDILQLIDWNQLYPVCINYENRHLKDNVQPAKDLLLKMGYTLKEDVMDTLACQVTPRS